jgi:hypothetical protein
VYLASAYDVGVIVQVLSAGWTEAVSASPEDILDHAHVNTLAIQAHHIVAGTSQPKPANRATQGNKRCLTGAGGIEAFSKKEESSRGEDIIFDV